MTDAKEVDKWCLCESPVDRTCIGCLIEKTIVEHYGGEGIKKLLSLRVRVKELKDELRIAEFDNGMVIPELQEMEKECQEMIDDNTNIPPGDLRQRINSICNVFKQGNETVAALRVVVDAARELLKKFVGTEVYSKAETGLIAALSALDAGKKN